MFEPLLDLRASSDGKKFWVFGENLPPINRGDELVVVHAVQTGPRMIRPIKTIT